MMMFFFHVQVSEEMIASKGTTKLKTESTRNSSVGIEEIPVWQWKLKNPSVALGISQVDGRQQKTKSNY